MRLGLRLGAGLILLAKPLTYAVPLMPVAPQKPRANSLNAARVAGVMPHRWPRPLPSIRSMKVVWSCSSLRPIASRTRHSAMLAMPLAVARIAITPVFLSSRSPGEG